MLSPTGQTLAEDDDGGGYPNARIVHACTQTAIYRIVATSYDGKIGPYQLTVVEIGGVAKGPGPGPQAPPKGQFGQIFGGAFDPEFKDEAPNGSLLVGLEIGLGKFVNNDIVKSVRPIYRDAKGNETRGALHGKEPKGGVTLCQPGYAVGGIIRAGLGIDAITLTYMKVNGCP